MFSEVLAWGFVKKTQSRIFWSGRNELDIWQTSFILSYEKLNKNGKINIFQIFG